MKKRYRVTRRGYIVFSLIGVVVLALLFWSIQMFQPVNELNEDKSNSPHQNSLSNQTSDASSSKGNTTNTTQPQNKSTPNESANNPNNLITNEEAIKMTARIYFEPDDFSLSQTYYDSLAKLTEVAKTNADLFITIEGNYNGYPGKKESKFWTKLANDRAEIVMAYFVAKGISPERIRIVNNGCSKMINQDDSWEEIAKNRRVDVSFSLK